VSSQRDSTGRGLEQSILAAAPKETLTIARALGQAGLRTWLVGGCVRDLIRLWAGHPLARPPADFDLCTDARPEVVQGHFRRVIPTGIAHGTVTVVLGSRHFEVTTLRGERGHTDGRRPDEVFFVSDIELDLARRDFTVNAIAFDLEKLELIDPFRGQEDLEKGVLRAVGDALTRFSEDGLRVLRCARFAATLELEVEPATKLAMRPSLGSFAKVAGERVRDEWLKALACRKPSRAFRLLRSEGLLAITCPELYPEGSAAADAAYDAACTLLDDSDVDPILRLALLVVAAPPAPPAAEAEGALPSARARSLALALAERLRLSGAEKTRLTSLSEPAADLLHAPPDLSTASALRHLMRRIGAANVPDVGRLIRQASPMGSSMHERAVELEARLLAELQRAPALSVRDLQVTGGELMAALGMKPGREVGRLLEHLLERVLDDPSQNERERLLSLAKQLK